jgi:hypothetical protein
MSKLFFVTDVESTGPHFSQHNMYEFASVPITSSGDLLGGMKFEVALRNHRHYNPTLQFLKSDLNITPATLRERKHQLAPDVAMSLFDRFISDRLKESGCVKPVFIADNLAFDWGFIHEYFLSTIGMNPFGHAGRNIPDLSLALYGKRDTWEKFRTENHTHDSLDDTRGNSGALSYMIKNDGLVLD